MKKLLLLKVIILFLIYSCENNLSYIGEFEQQYSLNCILRSDTTIQFATVKKSYPPNQHPATTDVEGVRLSLILPDTTLIFSDSTFSDFSVESKVKTIYYLSDFVPPKNTLIKIKAELSNGKVLTSETRSPRFFKLNPELESESNTAMRFNWSPTGSEEGLIFRPSFFIKYFLAGDPTIRYQEVKGEFYSSVGIFIVQRSNLDNRMSEISNGISNKSDIIILSGLFELKVFDTALGIYANSTLTFDNEFSVRVSSTDISNIDGGLGIFGCYFAEGLIYTFGPSYIRSFGYKPSQ